VRAAVLQEAGGPLEIVDLSPVGLGPHDVRVRVGASGVCHSDLKFLAQPPRLPIVLGHEGAGTVLEVGARVERVCEGDRVIAVWAPVCGRCWWCVNGEPSLCAEAVAVSRTPPWTAAGEPVWTMTGLGTFAEEAVVDERALVKVESSLPDSELALIGCAVTTGISAALVAGPVKPGATVVVFGCGGVGQAVVQGARLAGASRIIAVDPVAMKRESALAHGATDALDPIAVEPASAVRELTAGRGADLAYEVVGRPEVAAQAYDAIRRGGTLVIVGGAGQAPLPGTSGDLVTSSKTVKGALYGGANTPRDIPRIVELAERGLLDLSAMV
jgi:S-(hydroxymethyl)glutathione dehydrogenase/alcohol dehydrogenase